MGNSGWEESEEGYNRGQGLEESLARHTGGSEDRRAALPAPLPSLSWTGWPQYRCSFRGSDVSPGGGLGWRGYSGLHRWPTEVDHWKWYPLHWHAWMGWCPQRR